MGAEVGLLVGERVGAEVGRLVGKRVGTEVSEDVFDSGTGHSGYSDVLLPLRHILATVDGLHPVDVASI